MDFPSEFASYGIAPDAVFSPPDEDYFHPVAVDINDPDLNEADTRSSITSTHGFFDYDSYFTLPFTSMESEGMFPGDTPFNSTIQATFPPSNPPPSSTSQSTPLSQLEPPTTDIWSGASVSPQQQHHHRTPSTNNAYPEQPQPSSSATPSRHPPLKREPTDEEAPTPNKRGRPRRSKTSTSAGTSTTSASSATPRRLPHNQVERKYRENLNAELERLRRAIPTLSPRNNGTSDANSSHQPKPSKSMILAGAIEYIEQIEKERDEYRAECERLKRLMGERT
jgi:hypothetical protein